jgi:cellulose 1,4-beta-cellobiosidase
MTLKHILLAAATSASAVLAQDTTATVPASTTLSFPSFTLPTGLPPSGPGTGIPPPFPTTFSTSVTSAASLAARATSVSGNPFENVQLYANPYYSSEIYTSAIPSLTGTLATAASAVAEVGTFVWL